MHFEDAVAHFFAEVEWVENFDAELHQVVQEIGGRTDVEREIGVGRGGRIGVGDFTGFELALGVVEGQGAQVVRRPVVGSNHNVSHGCVVGLYAVVIRENGYPHP